MDANALEARARHTQGAFHRIVGSVFGINKDYLEEAAELYASAGHLRRGEGAHGLAARDYERAARCFWSAKYPGETTRYLVEASKSYQSANNLAEAARTLEEVVTGLLGAASMRRLAPHAFRLGTLYVDARNYSKALEYFELSANSYANDGAIALGHKSYTTLADTLAVYGPDSASLMAAVGFYDRVIRESIESPSLKWSAKPLIFNSVLCRLLVHDIVAAAESIGTYRTLDRTNTAGTVLKHLEMLVEACRNNDEQQFVDYLYQYDRVERLSPTSTKLSLRLKHQLRDDELL